MSEHRPPGPKGHFILDNLQPFLRDQLGYISQISKEYGDFVSMPILGQAIYLINKPCAIQDVLVKRSAIFKRTSRFKRVFRQIVGEGLMTLEDKVHQRRRQLLQPAFHHGHINTYADIMVEQTLAMLNQWDNGQEYDLHHEMMSLTLDIVSKTLFGADLSDELYTISKAISTNMQLFSERLSMPIPMLDWLPTRKNQTRRQAKHLLEDMLRNIIAQRRISDDIKDDFLSMLLASTDINGEYLTDHEVLTEALTFLMSGHETSANALTWTMYLIAEHPEVEAKLLEEIDVVMGRNPANLSHLPKLNYVTMVIKETMRLYPPIWIISRVAMEDAEIAGYHIKKGSVVLVCPYTMHRNVQYFPEPDSFIPERFANISENTLPKYAYFPFGGGERICIGKPFAQMEMNLVLATILQRYRLEHVSNQQIEPKGLVTLRPKTSVSMRTRRRKQGQIGEIET